jgi:predicted aspartyl protease
MAEAHCGFDEVTGDAHGSDLLVSFGPTILVDIGLDPAYLPSKTFAVPLAGLTEIQALVDTGATTSCIDNSLAVELGLPIVDRMPIAGVGGQHIANLYLAQIHVPALNRTLYGTFAGVNLRDGGQPHSALMGRTFLRHYRMVYNGTTGSVTISDS